MKGITGVIYGGARSMNDDETSFSIDKNFARFGSKSYAIDKINTVDIRTEKPGSLFGSILLLILGMTLLLLSFGGFSAGDKGAALIMMGFSALVLWGSYSIAPTSSSGMHTLYLTTSSSESQAMNSKDRAVLEQLRARIEAAMAGEI